MNNLCLANALQSNDLQRSTDTYRALLFGGNWTGIDFHLIMRDKGTGKYTLHLNTEKRHRSIKLVTHYGFIYP